MSPWPTAAFGDTLAALKTAIAERRVKRAAASDDSAWEDDWCVRTVPG
jgi:hypothetical protein